MSSDHANHRRDDQPGVASALPLDRRKVPEMLGFHRYAAGVSRLALAEAAGVSEATIARLERGEHRPQRRTAAALAAALGVSAADLFGAAYADLDQDQGAAA